MMKIISGLEQGSSSWLQWRHTKLTATNAAVIMGLNPWTSKLDLWQEKTLGWEKTFTQKEIARMEAGTRMEPVARQAFICHTGILVEPIVAEHDVYSYIAASFDGISKDLQNIVEIKCGQKSFAMAKEGLIPDYYTCQMQHQMFVSGLDSCFYFCFNGSDNICLLVKREQEFIDLMIEKEMQFWINVQSFTPP